MTEKLKSRFCVSRLSCCLCVPQMISRLGSSSLVHQLLSPLFRDVLSSFFMRETLRNLNDDDKTVEPFSSSRFKASLWPLSLSSQSICNWNFLLDQEDDDDPHHFLRSSLYDGNESVLENEQTSSLLLNGSVVSLLQSNLGRLQWKRD